MTKSKYLKPYYSFKMFMQSDPRLSELVVGKMLKYTVRVLFESIPWARNLNPEVSGALAFNNFFSSN